MVARHEFTSPESLYEPNFQLDSIVNASAYFKKKAEAVGVLGTVDDEIKSKISRGLITELIALKVKTGENVFKSKLFKQIETDFEEIISGTFDFYREMTISLLEKNIIFDPSDIYLDSRDIAKIAEKVAGDKLLSQRYAELFSRKNTDEHTNILATESLFLEESFRKATGVDGSFISSETLEQLLKLENKFDFLVKFFINFEKLTTKSQENFRNTVSQINKSEIANLCIYIIDKKNIVSPIIFEYLGGADSYFQSVIIKTLLANGFFSIAKKFIPRSWQINYFISELITGSKGLKSETYEFIEDFTDTVEQKQDIIRSYVLSSGYDAFLSDERLQAIVETGQQMPKSWFIDLLNSIKYSKEVAYTIPDSFAKRFPLSADLSLSDILETGIIHLEKLVLPSIWQKQINNLPITKSQALTLLGHVVRGHGERLIKLGGNDFLEKIIDFDLSDSSLGNLLYEAVEAGWNGVPQKVKDKLVKAKWDYFPTTLLATNDFKAIATLAANSRLKLDSLNSEDLPSELKWVRALFVGCNSFDVNTALDSELFRTLYKDYMDYAESLIALGEKALVIRCAARGISLDEVKKLIDLARVQPNIRFETTAVLTGLHKTNIYWEEREDQSVEGLFWDPVLKDYINQEAIEPVSAKDFVYNLASHADPSNYESVFFLVNLAVNQPDRMLKDSERLTEKHFKDLFKGLVSRTNADTRVLKDLGSLAGYKKPEDYEEVLLEIINGYPFASEISNIIKLSEGSISPQRFKEISYRYLNTEVRFSADTCLVLFKHAQALGEPFTREEKRVFWDTFLGDFEKKNNISSLSAGELQVFLDEEVIDQGDIRLVLQNYIESYGPKPAEVTKMINLGVTSQREFEIILSNYVVPGRSLNLSVLIPFQKISEERQYFSEEISRNFAEVLREKSVDFTGLVYILTIFEKYLSEQQVKDKVIFIAEQKGRITNEFVALAEKYTFTKEESRRLCDLALANHIFYIEPFKVVYEISGFSEKEKQEHLEQVLLGSKNPIDYTFVEYICSENDPQFVYDTAVSYAISYDAINRIHLNTLKNFLAKVPGENRIDLFEAEIREKDSRVTFFDDSELAKKQTNTEHDFFGIRELFIGTDAIDIENESENLQENNIFFINAVLFGENRAVFSQEKIAEILGSELSGRIAELKQSVAQKVLSEGKNWMIQREQAFHHFKVMGHGTWQAYARKEGVARSEEEKLDSIAVVKAITQGPDGVGIRGEKATLGAFANPGTNGNYGSVYDGSLVMFFVDDVIGSHVSVSTDPMGADGFVGLDHTSKKYVQIPNRVLFNPQAGSIEGVELNHEQMADYVLEFRHIVESNEELVSHVLEKVNGHVKEKHPDATAVLKNIHQLMRSEQYPESAILWARDYYLRLLLSDAKSDQLLAGVIERVVKGLVFGQLDGDLRSHIDTIRLNWDEELQQLAEKPLAFMKLLNMASEKMKLKQKAQFTESARKLKDRDSKSRVGVAKQHMLQVRFAEKSGDVPERNVTDNLRSTRALFMDSEDNTEYLTSLLEVKKYADYMQNVKESVLNRTFQRAIGQLDQVNAVFYQKYADKISVCSAGSIGRGEVVISSDIDYLVLVDDSELSEEDLTQIKRTLFKVGENMNQILTEDFNVRPDAGLANKDRQPIVLLSKVTSYKLDATGSRQVLEPTEMLDVSSVDGNDLLIQKFKEQFVKRSEEISLDEVDSLSLHDFISNEVAKYDKLFNGGFSQLLSRDQLIDFKLQIQRIFNFYIYKLVAEHVSEISDSSLTIPNKTLDKISFLKEQGYITDEVAARFTELQLLLYRMRYRTDVLNSAKMVELSKKQGAFIDERAKIEAKFDPQQVSQQEYSRFLDLIQFFAQNLEA